MWHGTEVLRRLLFSLPSAVNLESHTWAAFLVWEMTEVEDMWKDQWTEVTDGRRHGRKEGVL